MTIILLTAVGGVLILAGLVLLFSRNRDGGTETKLKFKDVEISSPKPSILLICLGVILVVIPHFIRRSEPGPFQPVISAPTETQEVGSRCCFANGACPIIAPGPVGQPCVCWDALGNTAQGTVCN